MEKDTWDAFLYDSKHSFISNLGTRLIELLAPIKGEKILDLGCGTGDLANTLYNDGVNIIGVDKSANMIEQAIRKYPQIEFRVQDAITLDYKDEFDAVFSNATLHWVQPANLALQGIYKSLKQGGRFIAEFGGKGNVEMITNEIIYQIRNSGSAFSQEQFPWYFPSIAEYSTLMEATGFRLTFAQHFDRPTKLEGSNGLKNWINMFGSQFFDGIPEHVKSQIINNVDINLRDCLYKDSNWFADYKRIRIVGVK